MSALGAKLASLGYFNTTAIADLAITANQVYKDSNGQVRIAGIGGPVQADSFAGESTASLQADVNPRHRGGTGYIY